MATRGERRVQRAGRALAASCALAAGVGTAVALAGAGGLDPSFGTGGATVIEHPTSTFPVPVGVAPDGTIVAVTSNNGKVTVARRLPDGAPDTTFGSGGGVVLGALSPVSANGIAIQADGKIVVVGTLDAGTSADAIVWRLTGSGALDTTFNASGVAELNSHTFDQGLAVAIQPDGKIVVAGQGFDSKAPTIISVWRLTAEGGTGAINGNLDPSFDTDGVAGVNDTTNDSVRAIALQADGKILLAGQTELAGTPNDAVVWRLKADGGTGALNGALDPTFDVDGQANLDAGGSEQARGIAVRPDGAIYVAGFTTNAPGGGYAMVWRLKPNGGTENTTNDALDPGFDTDGAAQIDGGGFASAQGIALQPDGKVLVTGNSQVGANPAVADIWRLTADGGAGAVNGALDPTFGAGGVAGYTGSNGAAADALALQSDRRIVAAGGAFNGNLLLFRALGDPFSLSVTTAGGGSGSVQSAPAGIACGTTCSAAFDDGSTVSLTATPASRSIFTGWSGSECKGTGACTLTMTADHTVTATFAVFNKPPPPLSHFALKSSLLHVGALRRGAKRVLVLIVGLPPGTKVAGKLLAAHSTLAKASGKAGSKGRVQLTFTLSKRARHKLHSRKLKRVTLQMSVTPPGDTSSKASLQLKLKR